MTVKFETATITTWTDPNGGTHRSTHSTPRSAQIYAAIIELAVRGWGIRGPASGDNYRRPLTLPGEKVMEPLDGALCDRRAQGFTAWREGAELRVDASAGLPLLYLLDDGDTAEAKAIVERYLANA